MFFLIISSNNIFPTTATVLVAVMQVFFLLNKAILQIEKYLTKNIFDGVYFL